MIVILPWTIQRSEHGGTNKPALTRTKWDYHEPYKEASINTNEAIENLKTYFPATIFKKKKKICQKNENGFKI